MDGKITSCFSSLLIQLRLWHWQANSFAEHEAFGKIYDSANDIVDELIEVCAGVYGKDKIAVNNDIRAYNLKDQSPSDVIPVYKKLIKALFEQEENTEILNLRDEILGQLSKLEYLLTLK